MQGPAPDGFHVPLTTERQAVYDIWTALGGGSSDGTNFGIALKLPKAGYRYGSSAGVYVQGTNGYYWSSSRYNASNAHNLNFNSSNINPQNDDNRSYGGSVRCFKNEPTVPTSFWTKLYGTSIESGGIFWSSEDGLISLSSDGNTWITIADKNLGATTVWNNGDTLSEANCGKYYQRGNNYGFPFTGSVTTSSTQVNASTYGPGNYYSSSTFITYLGAWDSTDNGNLRGGVDGNVPTMTELKNAYIGEYEPNFATQGPAPDGFHVPLENELTGLVNVATSLGLNASQFSQYFKLPLSGYINRTGGAIVGRGGFGYIRSSSAASGYNDSANIIEIFSTKSYRVTINRKSTAVSIRPFKNTSLSPDGSWVKLYQGAGNSGIYWNSSLGLITASSDGTTWMTISDKNLGATTVYNSGDALSDNNCGLSYQRGNNYGFQGAGPSTTSSTQVDASNYGPGNYYNSSTFITRSGTPYSWDTTDNGNLRGGVDGNVPVE